MPSPEVEGTAAAMEAGTVAAMVMAADIVAAATASTGITAEDIISADIAADFHATP